MTDKEFRSKMHDILNDLRLRIEQEDDDFHYDAVIEAQTKLNSLIDDKYGELVS